MYNHYKFFFAKVTNFPIYIQYDSSFTNMDCLQACTNGNAWQRSEKPGIRYREGVSKPQRKYTIEGPSAVHSRLCVWCLPDLLFNWESLIQPQQRTQPSILSALRARFHLKKTRKCANVFMDSYVSVPQDLCVRIFSKGPVDISPFSFRK